MANQQNFAQDSTLRTTHRSFEEADKRRKSLTKSNPADRVRVRLRSSGRFDVIVLKPVAKTP